MFSLKKILFIVLVFMSIGISAQKDSTQVGNIKVTGAIKINSNYFNPLSPSKAAFYSAILQA